MVYLFVGQDIPSKEQQLQKIKEEILSRDTAEFNQDTLYAKELDLKHLQERLLFFPFKEKKRILVIKGAQNLKDGLKAFLCAYVKKPLAEIVLVLDIEYHEYRDDFIRKLSPFVKTIQFKEEPRIDTFTLSRTLELKNAGNALRLLHQLLDKGEKPERILGGLRYAWEQNITNPQEAKRRFKLLLTCDIDIKTGRLKADFALEKLIISLCAFAKP